MNESDVPVVRVGPVIGCLAYMLVAFAILLRWREVSDLEGGVAAALDRS